MVILKKANMKTTAQKSSVHIFRFVSILLFILLLSACINYPSERDGKNAFESKIKRAINEQIIDKKQINDGTTEILSFKKVNAQRQEKSGVKLYILEYEAEIRYPKGLNLKYKRCLDTSQFQGWDCYLASMGGLKVRDKGQSEKLNGEIVFEKTEKGWRDELGNIY